jgi:hypothetical protein
MRDPQIWGLDEGLKVPHPENATSNDTNMQPRKWTEFWDAWAKENGFEIWHMECIARVI